MALQCLHALTTWNDDTGAVIVDLVADGLCNLRHVLGQGNNHLQVFVAQSQATTDGFKLISTGRVLSTCHTCGQVVADDDSDVGILVDGIQQTRHA